MALDSGLRLKCDVTYAQHIKGCTTAMRHDSWSSVMHHCRLVKCYRTSITFTDAPVSIIIGVDVIYQDRRHWWFSCSFVLGGVAYCPCVLFLAGAPCVFIYLSHLPICLIFSSAHFFEVVWHETEVASLPLCRTCFIRVMFSNAIMTTWTVCLSILWVMLPLLVAAPWCIISAVDVSWLVDFVDLFWANGLALRLGMLCGSVYINCPF